MKYKIIRLALAAVAVLLGVGYLIGGETTASIVLPLMSLVFVGIAVVSYRESRAAGVGGFAAILPALSAILVALFAMIGTAVYFFG